MKFLYIFVMILLTLIVKGENYNANEDLREKVKPKCNVFDAKSLCL